MSIGILYVHSAEINLYHTLLVQRTLFSRRPNSTLADDDMERSIYRG